MVITFVVECLDFFRSQVDENHIAPSPKDRWLVFRQDGFRKLYPMFAIKKMQFYPVLSIHHPQVEPENDSSSQKWGRLWPQPYSI